LQELSLPAVRIAAGTAEVLDSNKLFSSLIDASALPDRRLWFIEGVLRYLSATDRADWEAAFSNQTPVQIHVQLNPPDGGSVDSVMWAIRRRPIHQLFAFSFCSLGHILIVSANPGGPRGRNWSGTGFGRRFTRRLPNSFSAQRSDVR
jgi:hypothetical protein